MVGYPAEHSPTGQGSGQSTTWVLRVNLLADRNYNPQRQYDLITGDVAPKGMSFKFFGGAMAYYVLGIESVSALIRLLYDNPFIAETCGCEWPDGIPSQPTFSRFVSRLAKPRFILSVKNILRALTRAMYARFPDFGKTVAIDSTDIKAWSHVRGKQKQHTSDPDAGWCVKRNTEGNKKYVWGFKVDILADTKYELPIAIDISSGNVNDLKKRVRCCLRDVIQLNGSDQTTSSAMLAIPVITFAK